MIKFFRHLRRSLLSENKVNKYLLYAIGEIVLVVIGILIALSINNWNEDLKGKNVEKELLENLVGHLKLDSISFKNHFNTSEAINTLHANLYNIGIKGIDTIKIDNPNLIRLALDVNIYSKKNDPLIAEKIKNKKIREEIISYFINLDQMELSYQLYQEIVIKDIRTYLRKKELLNLAAIFEDNYEIFDVTSISQVDIVSEADLIEISKDSEFQQLLFELKLKMMEIENVLKGAMVQNNKLKALIQNEVKKNY